jgi:FSR family fosmidomycin resistance protein-like MFS transporter
MYRTRRALAAHYGESVRRGAEVSRMTNAREPSSAKDWNLRGLLAIAFGHGVNDFYSGTVALTIFFVATNAGLSAWYQGAVGFLWYLTSSIVQPLFGAFSDRHGRWWFMPSAVLLVVVSISFASLAGSLWVLALLVIVGGFGSALMHPEAGKYAALLSGARKSGGISVFQIGGSIGFALGPLAIAALLAHFGRFGSLVLLPPGLLAAACVYAGIRHAHVAAQPAQETHRATSSAPSAPVDKLGIALVVGSTAVRFLTTTAFMTYLPNLLVARGGTIVQAGQLVTAFLLVGIIGMYLGGYLGDRLGSVAASVVALVAAVPCLLAFFFAPAAIGVAFLLLGSVFMAVQNAPGVVIVQSLLPRNLGMALGLINGVAFGAGSILVTAVGVAVTRLGPETALIDVSVMPLFGAAAYLVVARRLAPALMRPAASA